MREATKQQKTFINNYLANGRSNATQCAIDAGYSEKTAQSQSSQLLKNPIVKNYLSIKESEMAEGLRTQFIHDALQAYEVMATILKDKDAKDSDRIEVAKYFLEHSGFTGGAI